MSKAVESAKRSAGSVPASYVEYVEVDSQKRTHGWITCPNGISPKCEGRRYRQLPSGPAAWAERTPTCRPCARHLLRETEVLVHPKTGSKLNQAVRDKQNYRKSQLICANPDNNPDCLGDMSYMRLERFKHPEFRGVCQSCFSKQLAPRTLDKPQVLQDGLGGGPGTVLGFDRRKDGFIPVTYRCGGTELMPEATLFRYKSLWDTGKRKFPARCPKCRFDPDFHAESVTQARNVRRRTVPKKRKIGGQLGNERFDRDKFLADLNHAIRDLYEKGIQQRNITRKRIAAAYKLGGDFISPDAITKRLRLCGVDQEFPDYVQQILRDNP